MMDGEKIVFVEKGDEEGDSEEDEEERERKIKVNVVESKEI